MATLTIQDNVDGATAYCGGTLTSSHSGFDSAPSSYQWKRNGVNITNATSPGYGTKFFDIGQSITCVATGLVSGVSTPVTSNAVVVSPPRPAYVPFALPALPGRIFISTVDSSRYELKIGSRHYGSFQVDAYGLPTLANEIAYRFKRRLFDASFVEDSFGEGLSGLPGGGETPPDLGGVAEEDSTLTISPPTGVPETSVTYEWYTSDDNFVGSSDRIAGHFGLRYKLPVGLAGKWIRVKALLASWTGATISIRELWSNILGPIVPAGGAVFAPPTLTDGGTVFGSWVASTEPDVGSSPTPGYDENAIGIWCTPTMDVLKNGEEMYVGVIARHMNGIDKVQFSLNDGPWVDVTVPSTNTNDQGRGGSTTAYWIKITSANTTQGMNELRAKIIPAIAGKPRILQGAMTSSFFYTGSGTQYQHRFEFWSAKTGYVHATDPVEVYCGDFGLGTPNDTNNGLTKATPVATLQQAYYRLGGSVGGGSAAHDISGKTVWLGAGSFNHEGYSFGKLMLADKCFVHVRKDPAISIDNCVWNGDSDTAGLTGPGLKMKFVAFHDIKISPRTGTTYAGTLNSIDYYTLTYSPPFKNDSKGIIWFNGCLFKSPNGTSAYDVAYRGVAHPNDAQKQINASQDPTNGGLTTGWKTTLCTYCDVDYYYSTPLKGLMVKHCTGSYIEEDLQRNVQLSYKLVGDHIGGNGTGYHPDLWQNYQTGATMQNCLCIDLTAVDSVSAQGFFCHGDTSLFQDIWIEKWRAWNDYNGTDWTNYSDTLSCMQWQQPLRHTICKDIIFRCEQAGFLLYRAGAADSDFTAKNVIMWGVYLVTTNPLTATPVTANTAIFQTYGGSALGTWPGTLPWTEPTTGIVYKAL